MIGRATGGDAAGPAGNKGHAMAAFPLVALHAARRAGAVVLMVSTHGDGGRHLGAIVARENNKRVLGEVVLLQRLHQFADDVVHFKNEIAVWPGLGLALKRVTGKGRQMHGLHGVKEKERFVGGVLGMLREEFLALLEEHEVDLFQIEIRRDHARTVVA